MMPLLRQNPGLLIWVILLCAITAVCLLVGGIMSRSGASLRPILWFAGFALIVGLPQFFAHLGMALTASRRDAPKREALAVLAAGSERDALRAAARRLFGPDADPDLVADARALFSEALGGASNARFASLPTGESVLIAEFPGHSEAQRAWVTYLRVTGLNQMGGKGDTAVGYSVTRPTGDRAYVAQINNLLGVWTAPDDGAIRRRLTATGFPLPRRAPLGPDPSASAPASSGASRSAMTTLAWGAGIAIYALAVIAFFFKGASWSASATPKPGVARQPEAEVQARIEALNAADTPFHIERGSGEHELFATWRFADARWLDLARARGLRRTFRVRMVFDPGSGCVRTTDYTSALDWSAGRGGADLHWKAEVGLILFQREHARVFGLQFAPDGSVTPNLSYAYTFNPQELKEPLSTLVTQSGWTWRPVVWQGPTWLRWLTE